MRLKDFKKTRAQARVQFLQQQLRQAILTGNLILQLRVIRKLRAAKNDLLLIQVRSMHIKLSYFNINAFSDEDSLRNFRFTKQELPRIVRLVKWNNPVTKRNRYKSDPLTGTCILLRRLSSPCRCSDLNFMFGMHDSALSEVFYDNLNALFGNCAKLVTQFRTDLIQERPGLYSTAVTEKGGLLNKCVGFIDGTRIQIARPGGPASCQKSMYSGHKRMHCLSYQTVTTPDGIVLHLFGPVEGRQPDVYMYRKSGIDESLRNNLLLDGEQYYIYGDAAYILKPWLQTEFPTLHATQEQLQINETMNGARTSVEWSYGEVKRFFSTQDYSRKLKVGEVPVAMMYICCILLLNFKTCLGHRSSASSYSQSTPPSLERYTQVP